MISKEHLTKKLFMVEDPNLSAVKDSWFHNQQSNVSLKEYIMIADEWFKSTDINNLYGWESFKCVDACFGCTHFIESFIIKHGWDGFQILEDEYNYYTLMGKEGVSVENLRPNVPLILSMPNWKHGTRRKDWVSIVTECERKNIDIHIDFAWLTIAKDIDIDLTHPCIKSFAMSISKYNMSWNRIGLRWSRQRHMDSITMSNHWQPNSNTNLMAYGVFFMKNIERDHGWNYHGANHYKVCKELNLYSSDLLHVAFDKNNQPIGIGKILTELSNSTV